MLFTDIDSGVEPSYSKAVIISANNDIFLNSDSLSSKHLVKIVSKHFSIANKDNLIIDLVPPFYRERKVIKTNVNDTLANYFSESQFAKGYFRCKIFEKLQTCFYILQYQNNTVKMFLYTKEKYQKDYYDIISKYNKNL